MQFYALALWVYMFEIIGIIVVVWFVYVVVKSLLNGAMKATMNKSFQYAKELGVPKDFSFNAYTNQYDEVKDVIKLLSNEEGDFKTKDVYQQYGHAYKLMYQREINTEARNQRCLWINSHISNQLRVLQEEKTNILINDVFYAYVFALASTSNNTLSVSLNEVKQIITYIFSDQIDEYQFFIDNGFNLSKMSSNFYDKMGALLPIAEEECAQNEGNYLIRYMRKVEHDLKRMHTEIIDIKNIDPYDFLKC